VYLLEAAECFEVWLVSANHVHGVLGRRTSDDIGSAWGWPRSAKGEPVRPSFVPPRPVRELRDLTRYRTSLVRDRTRVAQRLEKILQDAGIKLTVGASEMLGASGRAVVGALAGGERDPGVLAELAEARLRNRRHELVGALTGRFAGHHGFLCRQMLDHAAALGEQSVPGISTITASRLIAKIGVDVSVFPPLNT